MGVTDLELDEFRPRVLLVDDDEMVLAILEDQLAEHCDCICVSDPRQALVWLAADEFDVLVSDQIMPHLSGDQLLAKAAEQRPGTERILVSGYGDPAALQRALEAGRITAHLAKPWSVARLLDTVLSAALRARGRRHDRDSALH